MTYKYAAGGTRNVAFSKMTCTQGQSLHKMFLSFIVLHVPPIEIIRLTLKFAARKYCGGCNACSSLRESANGGAIASATEAGLSQKPPSFSQSKSPTFVHDCGHFFAVLEFEILIYPSASSMPFVVGKMTLEYKCHPMSRFSFSEKLSHRSCQHDFLIKQYSFRATIYQDNASYAWYY